MSKPIDTAGQKFGYLKALYLIPQDKRKNTYRRREWLCICDCGKQVVVEQRFLTVKGKQHINSCGCIRAKSHLLATSKCPWLTMDYLWQWTDWDKYAFLHKALVHLMPITKLTKDYYFAFIKKFYHDKQFNLLYSQWLKHQKEHDTFYDWYKPSIDHIIPKSKGGTCSLDNLQFLTVFENLAKRDMTQQEWEKFKSKTNTTSDLF